MRWEAVIRAALLVATAQLALAACSSFAGAPTVAPDDAATDACATCSSDAIPTDGPADADADAGRREVIVAGGTFGCALHERGTVSCWGRNSEGETGQPAEGDLACDDLSRCRPSPSLVPGLTKVTHLASGLLFACARTEGGAVLCWGSNDLGVLGAAGPARPTPAVVSGLPHAIDVSAGAFNACARVEEAGKIEVYCWGTNRAGMLGTVPSGTMAGPTRIAALTGAKSVVLSRGSEHGCAIAADDTVVCWGKSFAGSLGHTMDTGGDTTGCPGGGSCNHVPALVGSPTFKATELALGLSFACARVLGTDEVACWGYNAAGSLGQSVVDTDSHPLPSVVPGALPAASIVASGAHACALVTGKVLCWGSNGLGELGNGNASDLCTLGPCKSSPQAVLNLTGVVRISAGFNASFASTEDGHHWAWGGNPDARLGHAPGTSSDLLKCTSNTGRCNPVPQPLLIP